MTLTLFNGKSLVERTRIELNKEREGRPLLLTFAGKGRKLILWNGDNIQKEQGLHFIPLPLKAGEAEALAKAPESPAAPSEPDKPSPEASAPKTTEEKVKAPKTPEEAEAALKKLGAEVKRDKFADGKPIEAITFLNKKVTDDVLVLLRPLTTLQKLKLIGTKELTDKGIKHLSGLVKLEDLSLVENPITDAGLVELEPLSKLKTLSLIALKITDDGLVHLKGMKELDRLDLGGNDGITDKGLDHLKGLTKLKTLRLLGTRVSEKGAAAFRKARPDVNVVN